MFKGRGLRREMKYLAEIKTRYATKILEGLNNSYCPLDRGALALESAVLCSWTRQSFEAQCLADGS